MKLRTKYILFVGCLHAVALVLSYFVFKSQQILFIVSEVVLLLSLVLAWQLYHQLLQPLQTLMSGVEAIKDRDFNVKFVKTGKFEMDQLIDVYNSMIDQLRNERTLQEQQHFFLEKLINTSPTGIVILDHDSRIQQVNPRAAEMLATTEEQLLKSNRDTPSALLSEIYNIVPGQSKTVSVNGVRTYKIQKSHFVDRGFTRTFVMIEELTAEILAAEKKAYGKVIRMMAHEVNNTIGPVNSIIASALSRQSLWADEGSVSLRNALEVASQRNQNLNIFMRNFADVVRLPDPVKRPVNVGSMLEKVTTLMSVHLPEKKIELTAITPNETVMIIADEQQMEQALINITKNAIEAADQTGKVELSVSPSEHKIVVSNTGKGIDPSVAEHIFSPFFSTKKDGQGIGLTLVKEILVNHGYTFRLANVAPGRTEFIIFFA